MTTDTSNSGIHVVEGLSRGQGIPVDGDSVTAFVGPAPRGPVDRAIPVTSVEQFQKVFGAPDCHGRMEDAIRQFFSNGGSNAVVVRVCGSNLRARVRMPAADAELVLEARNPGPLEFLRASVDYDGIDTSRDDAFNLIIQRLRAPGSAWIDEQEVFRTVSIDTASRDYIGYVLSTSELVTLHGDCPEQRPDETILACTAKQSGYVKSAARKLQHPAPTDYDLVGSAELGTGLSALEQFPDIGQVVMLSGSNSAPLGPIALLAADQFCRAHQALLVIDPPERWRSIEDVELDQQRSGFASPNAVTWFPGVHTRNLQHEKTYATAAGAVAASLVVGERRDGVLHMHAEDPVMLRGGVRPVLQLDEADVARLNRLGVNALTQRSALHLQLCGNVTQARYGSISAHWNELQFRRQVLFILRRIRNGTRWTFFAESEPATWQDIREQIESFLTELHARSVLAGENAEEAFFVKCDADTNIGLGGRAGDVAFVVGFALTSPGEYLAFRFRRSHDGCRIKELGWQTGLELAV